MYITVLQIGAVVRLRFSAESSRFAAVCCIFQDSVYIFSHYSVFSVQYSVIIQCIQCIYIFSVIIPSFLQSLVLLMKYFT